jgi:putative oxidoreductase
MVFAHSQLWYGWDRITRDRRGEIAAREAEERAREAELRAARAEGAAEAARERQVVVERD